MKKLSILLVCALFFASSSCEKDNDMMPLGGGGNSEAPEMLDCAEGANDLLLTNRNTEGNGVDYILDCNLKITGDFKVEPGTTIQVNDGFRITVESEGSLSAIGTVDEPITFKGTGSGATWEYILFNTQNAKNRLHHVSIENAGNNDGWSILRGATSAVYLEGRLSMTNTSIIGSNGSGFTVNEVIDDSSITEFSNNIFRDMEDYPIVLTPKTADDLDFSSCTFSGNGKPYIGLFAYPNTYDIGEDIVWRRSPLPYFVDKSIRLAESLTIESGNEIIFTSGSGIETLGDGFFKIEGTEANHVIVRGEVAASAAWLGFEINNNNPQNVFSYLDISDGGQRNFTFVDTKGNIALIGGDARLTLNNCTSTRAECDVVISTTLNQNYTFENNSPNITNVCID